MLQDTNSMYKNPLCSYTLTIKFQEKNEIYFAIATKNKIHINKLNKTCEEPIY